MTRPTPSSNSFNYQWTYDVFLNFRGEDTRNGFTGNLYNALHQKGIYTFIDDQELRKGDEITPALLKAIEESRIAITVFSKNYASSTFCLDELVKIVQCIKRKGRLVWPIFYDVEPSDVRHQKGNYEQALTVHQKNFKANEKLQIWKQALREVANLSGLHFNHGHEYEYQFIEKIVKEISSKINRTPLHIAKYPVGLDSRVMKVKSLLGVESNETVIMVGIYGIGGMGKTTIARAVYNSIADQFDGLCFLYDIKKNSSKLGLEQMQERMLFKTIRMDIKVEDVNEGVPIIQRRLNKIKTLLILDNVDKVEQLEKLAGNCDWFGSGSKIIITTRDKHLLARHGVERLYEVEEFNNEESLELLSWNAFKNKQVDLSYWKVLNYVIDYAQGLPLALEVIGSHLFGKSIIEWKSAVNRYRRIPAKEVQEILKVSFDGLEEDEQEIFLDIASFFKGKELKYVIDIVGHAHGFDPSYCIGVLIDKSLINIENDHVEMHDLIQDMGREIIRKESPREPGKRSRLWYHEDIVHILEENKGTDKICCIVQDNLFEDIKVNWDGKSFRKIKNLKILILKKAWFSKGPEYLPNSLRVLHWPEYPSSCLPVDFHPRKLVILDLHNSYLQLLAPVKKFENLSVLDLSDSQFITQICDVSGIPNLTELRLDFCENLIEIHYSVGYMAKLKILSAFGCVNLRTFPGCIRLPSLQNLILERCISLEKFPKVLEKMENITQLDLSETNLELPCSILNLTGLQELVMENCRKNALLPKLEGTYIEGCGEFRLAKQDKVEEELISMQCSKTEYISLFMGNISDKLLSMYLSWFTNVEYLDLSCNNFTILPACIKECRFLWKLFLNDCKHLSEIRGIPPNIIDLQVINCTSLSSESKSILLSQKLHEAGDKQFVLPGASIPKWFDHCSSGPSISFWFRNNFPLVSLCFVVTPPVAKNPTLQSLFADVIINGNEMFYHVYVWDFDDWPSILADHIVLEWSILNSSELNEILLKCEWNHVEVCIYTKAYDEEEEEDDNDELIGVKEIGMNVMKQENRMEDIQFINPYKRKKLDDLNWDSSFEVSTWYGGPSNSLFRSHISHLIDRDTGNWKEDKTVEAILREGINDSEDELFWVIWHYEKLWKLQLPENIKIFLLKVHHNGLVVKENLTARETNMDDHTCPNCGAVGESIMHTLVACPFAEVIWSLSPIMLRSQSLPQASFSSWWEGLSSSLSYLPDSTGMLEIAGFICWTIWKCRNEKVFNRGSRQVISLVMQQVNEFQASWPVFYKMDEL